MFERVVIEHLQWWLIAVTLVYIVGIVVCHCVLMDKSHIDWDESKNKFVNHSDPSEITPKEAIIIVLWPVFATWTVLVGLLYMVLRFLFSFWYAFTGKRLDRNPILAKLFKLF